MIPPPTTSAERTATLPDLGDTRTAFAHMSDADLWRAQQLFRIIGNPTITAAGSWLTKVALGLHLPIKGVVKATIFRQFCGGETIEESLGTAARLAKSGVGTILDHSVEGQEDEATLDHTMEEILRTVAVAKDRKEIPFSVFKPTGICRFALLEKKSAGTLNDAEQAEWARVEARMLRLCQAAYDAGEPILVDAEESWIQPAIDALVERMMERFNRERAIVYNTVQLYRHDRLTANEVLEKMPKKVHNSTIRTQLRILEKKGLVLHEVVLGKFYYVPVHGHDDAAAAALAAIVQSFYKGSFGATAIALLSHKEATLSADEKAKIASMLAKA